MKGDYFMPNDDTIKLLRECSAGTEMAIASINDVTPYAKNASLQKLLDDYLKSHQTLRDEIAQKLDTYHDDEKSPHPIAKAMSWTKIHVSLLVNSTDQEVAKLMKDGCNMGIKSLKQYLGQYPAASSNAKKLTERLITLERDFYDALEHYL